MKLPRAQAVIFDMDGVLTDSEWFIAEAACRMFLQTHGVSVLHEDFKPFVGLGENRFLGGVAEKYGIENFQIERDKEKTYALYLDLIKGKLQALPGSVDFVLQCRSHKLKTALATSTDYVKMRANLEELGLDDGAFEATVNGLEVARKKPFPDLFLEAAKRIDIAPQYCWVVEDAVGGVTAAKRAGMRCLALLSSFSAPELLEAGADRVAQDLSKLSPEELLH